jgi:hypothetical protein
MAETEQESLDAFHRGMDEALSDPKINPAMEKAKASIQALNDSRPAREALAEQVGRIMMMTKDPTVMFPRDTAGKPPAPMPAITSLLYRVCDNDQTKFEEACRLVELFIVAALKEKTNGE